MFTKRISALLGASGLAAAGFAALAAAPAASATTGPVTGATIATKAQAGYQASGRDFRFITATITVPDDSLSRFTGGLYPVEYLQLSNGTQLSTQPILGSGDQFIRAGIVACVVAVHLGDPHPCAPGDWTAFVTDFSNGLGGPSTAHFFNLANVAGGDGVQFSIYYSTQGNELHFVINPPNASGHEPSYTLEENAQGAIFDHAAALDDWTDSTGYPVALPAIQAFQIGSFLGGALTTYSGARGSFAGPWTTSKVEATSNGLIYPSGTVRAYPTALYGDGLSSNGAVRSSDAFDEYLR